MDDFSEKIKKFLKIFFDAERESSYNVAHIKPACNCTEDTLKE